MREVKLQKGIGHDPDPYAGSRRRNHFVRANAKLGDNIRDINRFVNNTVKY